MRSIDVNFDLSKGKIKPLNGVNSGPKTTVFTYDASPLFKEANISLSRLHDVEYPYGSGEFVDIHCVFKNFDADENNPDSYDFGLTDLYIKAALDTGAKIVYRLGESIEHAPVKKYVYPPKDFAKWARICEMIIRHYNEGFASGHYWNITLWEIWNEPDLDQSGATIRTWGGTIPQFYDFYETAAKHLKKTFPHLSIGGPAIAGNIEWGTNFINEMSKRNVPLDFFAWHKYGYNIESYLKAADLFDKVLKDAGYTDTVMYLDEWNYVESWQHQPASFRKLVGIRGAAFYGALMVALQDSPVYGAEYFEADVTKEWCGIFQVKDMAIGSFGAGKSPCVLEPRKGFYSFKSFGELYRLGEQTKSTSSENNVYVCSAKNEENTEVAVMLVSFKSDWNGPVYDINLEGLPKEGSTISVYLTDESKDEYLEKSFTVSDTSFNFKLSIFDEQIRLIKIKAKQ